MDYRVATRSAAALIGLFSVCGALGGCAVAAVAGAAVSVVSTTVSATATVIGTGVDAAAGAVKAVTGSGDKAK